MATETLRPNGTTTGNWPSLVGAATHHAATNDNLDTTYIRNNTVTDQTDLLDLDNTGLSTETITSVDIRFRARSETAPTGHIQAGLTLSGTDSLAADETLISTTITNFTKAGISRPGGGSWAVADLNSLQIKAIGNGGANAIRCIELFVDVNYTTGAQVISPSLISSTATVYTPTLVPGTVTISPSLIASTLTVYAPSVSGGNNISPNLLASTLTFFTPTLTKGVVNITPSFIASTTTIYLPTLTGGAALTVVAYILNGVTIRGPQRLTETNSTLYAQNRVLPGNVNRDFYGANKRVWILEYRNNPTYYNVIKSIYDLYLSGGRTISWQVTGDNYSVSSTNVHVDLPERNFSARGTNYLSDYNLTLFEE